MPFSSASNNIEPRDPELPWAENGPGLYADESLITLDTGELVAVSVEVKWPDNNSGLALHGWARWINEDGSSKEDPGGAKDAQGRPIVIETSITINCDATMRANYTDKELAREVLLAVLGEEPTMVPVEVNPDAPVVIVATDAADWAAHPEKAAPGTILDPGATERPLISWSPDARLNASIRYALSNVAAAKKGINAAQALGV